MEQHQAWLACRMFILRRRRLRTLRGFGLNLSIWGPPATSPRVPTWPSSQWSAGIFYIWPMPILPGLAVFAGWIPARNPEAHNTAKYGAVSSDVLDSAGAGLWITTRNSKSSGAPTPSRSWRLPESPSWWSPSFPNATSTTVSHRCTQRW